MEGLTAEPVYGVSVSVEHVMSDSELIDCGSPRQTHNYVCACAGGEFRIRLHDYPAKSRIAFIRIYVFLRLQGL